jgi:electron transfer flavoprotein alpha subunit
MSINKRHKKENAKLVLLSSTTDSTPSSLVAVALDAGFASNVVGLPVSTLLSSKKKLSNKAFNITEISTDVKVLGL